LPILLRCLVKAARLGIVTAAHRPAGEGDEGAAHPAHRQATQARRRPNDRINFRCSPEFKELVAGLAKHLDCSIADVLEDAAEMLAKAKGYEGKHG
jgi:hypothetical protein